MGSKRRRAPSTTNEDRKVKRSKFTVEHAALPSITESGVLLVTGAGDVGQLGLGPDVFEKTRFTVVNLGHEVVDVCAGGVHTVCLTKDGKVLTFGCNDEGALGRNTSEEDAERTPGEVELPDAAIQISCGDSHTAALLKDGRVFVWGTFRDSHGSMGLTPEGNKTVPYEIVTDNVVVKISSGENHLAFLTKFGDVFTCGCAEQGQLGRITQRSSDRDARGGLGGKDKLSNLLTPTPLSLSPTKRLHFEDIWAGTWSTFAKVGGKDVIYVCGLNNYNQLGLKNRDPIYFPKDTPQFGRHNWEIISNAQHHTLALDKEGKVYAIGRKDYGRLGLGEVSEEEVVELTPVQTLQDKKVVHISCGSASSYAVTEEGDLYSWGFGSEGQLGTGQDEDCLVPTLIKSKQLVDRQVFKVSGGGQHTVILAKDVTPPNNNTGDIATA